MDISTAANFVNVRVLAGDRKQGYNFHSIKLERNIPMNPKDRYQKERAEAKEQRQVHIIQSAKAVFLRKGIERSTMNDIAEEANIGIATLFRYFPKKEQLARLIVVQVMNETRDVFNQISEMQGTCLDKMEQLLDYFISFMNKDSNLGVIIFEDLLNGAVHSSLDAAQLEEINVVQRSISAEFNKIIMQGERDGTVRRDIQPRELLTTVINAFGLFSSKLSLHQNIPMLEADVEPRQQLMLMKQMILHYIKPPVML
nr:TetR/AcrR family transcriptional regulator [Paenibacillus barcinonensis]